MTTISLIDGYVDEPTCLGVPPYISPYPRYIAGAISEFSPEIIIHYFTIDQIRRNPNHKEILQSSTAIIVITGMVVPGKYLAGYPLHPKEIPNIFKDINKPIKLLTGPAAIYGFGIAGGLKTNQYKEIFSFFDAIINGDPEIVIYELLQNGFNINNTDLSKKRKNAESIKTFSVKGAEIVKQHPYHPHQLIAEIETYRGCPRYITGGCSFCIEPSKGLPDFRSIESILAEINALYINGVRHFRLGNQPCLFSYKAQNIGTDEYPRPNPSAIETLFSGIRTIAPNLQTLHIDNVNPGIVARYPKESMQIIETILRYHTPGDVAAFGIESVDPQVIEQNNLKTDITMVKDAIRLFNKSGASRGKNGLPELLPGLNFIIGLKGETKHTFTMNYAFLKSLIDEHLLVRRINIRQLLPIKGTTMDEIGESIIRKHKTLFQSFKYKVKTTIEQPLLQQLIPKNTILTNVFTELHKGHLTFGRQLGSYPILVGIPGNFPLNMPYSIRIIDHGYRSVTGIPYPLELNTCPRKTIESLEGIGKKRAIRILRYRPFSTEEELKNIIDDTSIIENIIPFITLQTNGGRK